MTARESGSALASESHLAGRSMVLLLEASLSEGTSSLPRTTDVPRSLSPFGLVRWQPSEGFVVE